MAATRRPNLRRPQHRPSGGDSEHDKIRLRVDAGLVHWQMQVLAAVHSCGRLQADSTLPGEPSARPSSTQNPGRGGRLRFQVPLRVVGHYSESAADALAGPSRHRHARRPSSAFQSTETRIRESESEPLAGAAGPGGAAERGGLGVSASATGFKLRVGVARPSSAPVARGGPRSMLRAGPGPPD